MLLKPDGKGSSSKRTRYLNTRFFFITDLIEAREVEVRHCPTDQMIGDFFTKPLHSMNFKELRDFILNFQDGKQVSY